MNNRERMDAELAYIADKGIWEEQARCRKLVQKLNTCDLSDFDALAAIARELIDAPEGTMLTPPFYCDFGKHIHVGKNFYANYNCTMLDTAPITIGDNCFIAPNVGIYTAGHPIHPQTRASRYEYGKAITIGDNVWIGGHSVILPGVHIGSNVVIGAGSVVTRDIPDWVVAAGNPCAVKRKITDADRRKLFRDEEIDGEAWKEICGKYGW